MHLIARSIGIHYTKHTDHAILNKVIFPLSIVTHILKESQQEEWQKVNPSANYCHTKKKYLEKKDHSLMESTKAESNLLEAEEEAIQKYLKSTFKRRFDQMRVEKYSGMHFSLP
jgi:hypothetical protein